MNELWTRLFIEQPLAPPGSANKFNLGSVELMLDSLITIPLLCFIFIWLFDFVTWTLTVTVTVTVTPSVYEALNSSSVKPHSLIDCY